MLFHCLGFGMLKLSYCGLEWLETRRDNNIFREGVPLYDGQWKEGIFVVVLTELSLEFWKQEFRTPIWQKVGVPLEKVGVQLKKKLESHQFAHTYIFYILVGSDTFE